METIEKIRSVVLNDTPPKKNNAAEADGKLKTCKITKQTANKVKIFREKNG